MIDETPTYEEIKRRLETAEDIIYALKSNQVDAVIGKNAVALLKLQEVQHELQKSEEWRSLAVEAGDIGLWEYNPAASEFYGSERAYTLFEFAPDEKVGIRQVLKRILPSDRRKVFAAVRKTLQALQVPAFQVDFRVMGTDGGRIWLSLRGRIIFNKTPGAIQPLRVRGTVQDISEQKQLERSLFELNRSLEKRVDERTAEAELRSIQLQKLARELSRSEDRERQRIAGILHDDLQQVLAALRLRIVSLHPPGPGDDFQADLDAIEQIIDECIEKTRDLSHELTPPAVIRNGLVAAMTWLCKDMHEKFGLRITMDASPDADTRSSILPSVLYRCVRELLFNSQKHSGTDVAQITIRRQSGRLVLSVADDGKGANPMKLRQDKGHGGGLGLVSIEERIRFLGGSVVIDSNPGNGFCVTIDVPYEISD